VKIDQSDRPYGIARIAKRRPRHLHVFIGLIIVLSIMAAYVWLYTPKYLPPYLVQFATPQNQRGQAGGQGGRFGLRGSPVPVFAVVAKKAEVPVYVEGVGSSRALNTVTVRAQVDGKLMSVNFKEGQDVDKDFVLAENRRHNISGSIRPSCGQEEAGRSSTCQCPPRPGTLYAACADQFGNPSTI